MKCIPSCADLIRASKRAKSRLCPSTKVLDVKLSFMDARIKSGHDALMAGGATQAIAANLGLLPDGPVKMTSLVQIPGLANELQ